MPSAELPSRSRVDQASAAAVVPWSSSGSGQPASVKAWTIARRRASDPLGAQLVVAVDLLEDALDQDREQAGDRPLLVGEAIVDVAAEPPDDGDLAVEALGETGELVATAREAHAREHLRPRLADRNAPRRVGHDQLVGVDAHHRRYAAALGQEGDRLGSPVDEHRGVQ